MPDQEDAKDLVLGALDLGLDNVPVGPLLRKAKEVAAERSRRRIQALARALFDQDQLSHAHESQLVAMLDDDNVADLIDALGKEHEIAKSWAYALVLKAYRDDRLKQDFARCLRFVRDVSASDLEQLRGIAKNDALMENSKAEDQSAFNKGIREATLNSPSLRNALLRHGFLGQRFGQGIDMDHLMTNVIMTEGNAPEMPYIQGPELLISNDLDLICSVLELR